MLDWCNTNYKPHVTHFKTKQTHVMDTHCSHQEGKCFLSSDWLSLALSLSTLWLFTHTTKQSPKYLISLLSFGLKSKSAMS